jgi:hypothetical protein
LLISLAIKHGSTGRGDGKMNKLIFVAFLAVGSAVPALAQDYQSPYNPYPPQHYNNAPGLDAPGLTNIPGVRDEPPSYGSRPAPYDPVPTAPAYVPPSYDPYRSTIPSPYGQQNPYGR